MIIVAAVSDLHIGSTVSIAPPIVERDDLDDWHSSKVQKWLWASWLDYWENIKKLKKKFKADVFLVSNGDLFEGKHHGTTQIWSDNPADWFKAAEDVLNVTDGIIDAAFIVRGTEAHVGAAGNLEETFASFWASSGAPVEKSSTRVASWDSIILEASGVWFDIAHHGPMGRLEHTKANSLGRISIQVELEALREKMPVPNVVLQAHNHRWADTGTTYNVRVIAQPAWQVQTHYAKKITRSHLSDIGGMAFLCEKGDYTLQRFPYIPVKEFRKIWRSQSEN